MEIVAIEECNRAIYLNLAQAYEAEFSKLTEKKPLADGMFELDTDIADSNVSAFICYESGIPAGFAAIYSEFAECYEVAEFYIVPVFRKAKLGTQFAHTLWQRLPGNWTIKQITGADYATEFWRSAITMLPGLDLIEDKYEDEYWGEVTRQRFKC
ncbi:GNAT family N-acetyltransferase [Pseudoalteromonas luteoviolacea]|uniref:N-acetyltransferase domain-containing protein n=1 Tax=Pseudoalteromonas luteoviolacea H33 TaxID=1365251 RepID=A0A167E2J4_9GAMM|nr:hypothetical protein [Pseudoalteromonas luteoviolacea]KZN49941.1 hypothetical protein N476_17755 [Pseudoalteromonas luteoviolacea H33]KZN79041.1 hypothetical protein N477_06965 [Pseudoalteromonas luteoviolacea H33-S]MBQ4879917.1 hypothetical protein [Pseudoalteromonas luteoviolacea]MBQ4908925.1 hypothetical protein [Pseudoalteromonas luteoviolacea]